MRIFLITALAALTVASPDIGLKLRQQQQAAIGYLPPQNIQEYNPQIQLQQGTIEYYPPQYQNQQYNNQQQQTFNLNQHGNPPSVPEVYNTNHGSQQEVDQNMNQGGVPFHPPPIIHQIVPSAIGVAIPPRIIQSNPNAVAYKAPEYYQQQEPIITKHVYFHSAPEDDEQPIVQIKQQIVPPQKHYKIIFIKAPASGIRQAVQVPAIPQTEEKTIVYVLSKKEENIEVKYEKPAPLVPSKPEVYFIKYKAQKEANNQNTNAPGASYAHTNAGVVLPPRMEVSNVGGFTIGSTPNPIGAQKPSNNYLPPL